MIRGADMAHTSESCDPGKYPGRREWPSAESIGATPARPACRGAMLSSHGPSTGLPGEEAVARRPEKRCHFLPRKRQRAEGLLRHNSMQMFTLEKAGSLPMKNSWKHSTLK